MRTPIYLLCLAVLCSCTEPIRFEQPQPAHQNNLSSFPKKLQGHYLSDDSIHMVITDRSIIKWLHITSIEPIDDIEIDSTASPQKTTKTTHRLSYSDHNFTMSMTRHNNNDSVEISYSYRDTVFEISNHDVLRSFKNQYFLSEEIAPDNWDVTVLDLEQDQLITKTLNYTAELEDVAKVDTIRSKDGKSTTYVLNPKKKELKQLLKKGFEEGHAFKRVE